MSREPPLAAFTQVIEGALAEALGERGDITTNAVVPEAAVMSAELRSREAGRIAGTDAIRLVLERLPGGADVQLAAADGSELAPGATIAAISGSARAILTGERVILNLLGRLSGIATATAAVVRAVEGTGVAIKDTRKTTPGLRSLEKAAVAAAGGVNHRMGLDRSLIHISEPTRH